jgi:hypothetical protein
VQPRDARPAPWRTEVGSSRPGIAVRRPIVPAGPGRADMRMRHVLATGRIAIGPSPRPLTTPRSDTVGPQRMPGIPAGRAMFGLPNLRRNVCPHFYMTGARGAIPIQAPHLLKALIRQDQNVSRCQVRGGVHLEQGYVNDVCLTPRFNQCVFYEDDLTRD